MRRGIVAGIASGGLLMTAWASDARQAAPAAADKPVATVVIHGDKPGAKHDWIRAESRHFIVYGDTRRDDVSALLSNLERFRLVLRSLSDMDGGDHEPKLTLYYLSDQGPLRVLDPRVPEHAVGLYQSCEDGVQGYAVHVPYTPRAGVPVLQQDEDSGLTYIFQAYAGLDSETYRARMTYKDLLNDNDLYSVSETEQINSQAASSAARQADPNHPLRSDLTNIDPEHADAVAQAEVETEFQARAWLMTHWLLSSSANLGRLTDYVAAVGRGENRLDAFHRVFNLNSADMDNVLHDYLHHKAKLLRLTFQDMPVAEVQFDREPAAANHLMLDDAALRGCPSAAYGRALLADIEREAAQYPDSAFAHLALARAEIGFGDPQAALPWLQKQTRAQNSDFDAQYLLGRAELAVAQKSTDAAAYDGAKIAFTQAAKIDTSSAVNAFWYYRAQVKASGEVAPDAAGAAILAYKTTPDVDAYDVHAGLVYALAGDSGNAFAALHRVADEPRAGPWTETARHWIGRLKTGVSNEELRTSILALSSGEAGEWHGRAEWTQAYQAVLGDMDLQNGQADLRAVTERFEVMKGSVKGGGAGTKAAPALGVRMPDDDDD